MTAPNSVDKDSAATKIGLKIDSGNYNLIINYDKIRDDFLKYAINIIKTVNRENRNINIYRYN